MEQKILSRLSTDGVVDVTEHVSLIDTMEFPNVFLVGNTMISIDYLKRFSEEFLGQLRKKGYIRLVQVGNVRATGQVLLKITENLKEYATKILDDWFVLHEFLQVLKVKLQPVVQQVVEMNRFKKKEVMSKSRGLELMARVTSKFIMEQDVRREIDGLIYADFMVKVNVEMQKAFKDSSSLAQRNRLVLLEGFYRGILTVSDSGLREKLTKLLLDIKGKEFMSNCGQDQVNGFHVT